MRFLPVSTMAFLALLATMPCFGYSDNQNVMNGEHRLVENRSEALRQHLIGYKNNTRDNKGSKQQN